MGILINISLKFAPLSLIDNNWAVVMLVATSHLCKPMLTSKLPYVYMHQLV